MNLAMDKTISNQIKWTAWRSLSANHNFVTWCWCFPSLFLILCDLSAHPGHRYSTVSVLQPRWAGIRIMSIKDQKVKQIARILYQWVKKKKCSGESGLRIESLAAWQKNFWEKCKIHPKIYHSEGELYLFKDAIMFFWELRAHQWGTRPTFLDETENETFWKVHKWMSPRLRLLDN
jgi:hypothetical protein